MSEPSLAVESLTTKNHNSLVGESHTLNIAVLGPKNSFSYQAALLYAENIMNKAVELGILLAVNIFLYKDHTSVFESIYKEDDPIIIAPVTNSTTGLVPPTATKGLEVSKLETISAFSIAINHHLIFKHEIDLSQPENYHLITEIISHKAGIDQSQEFITLVNAARNSAGLSEVILTQCNSTAAGAETISQLNEDSTIIALGSKEAGEQYRGLKISQNPVQDELTNATTFVVVKNADSQMAEALAGLIKPCELPNHFIIKLPIADNLGSLANLIAQLTALGVDLDYIKVDHEAGQNTVSPYLSGKIPAGKQTEIQELVAKHNPQLNITYYKQNLDTRLTALKKQAPIEIESPTFYSYPKITTVEGVTTLTVNIENRAGALNEFLAKFKSAGINLVGLDVFAKPNANYAKLKATWKTLENQKDDKLLEEFNIAVRYQESEIGEDGKTYLNPKNSTYSVHIDRKQIHYNIK